MAGRGLRRQVRLPPRQGLYVEGVIAVAEGFCVQVGCRPLLFRQTGGRCRIDLAGQEMCSSK
jgi:hypothetical protein